MIDLINRQDVINALSVFDGHLDSEVAHTVMEQVIDIVKSIEKADSQCIRNVSQCIRNVSPWIPCSERLPEICEEDAHGRVTFSRRVLSFRRNENGFYWQGIDQYTTNNGGCWLSEVPFNGRFEEFKVVAWMPLPKPYKEEKEHE